MVTRKPVDSPAHASLIASVSVEPFKPMESSLAVPRKIPASYALEKLEDRVLFSADGLVEMAPELASLEGDIVIEAPAQEVPVGNELEVSNEVSNEPDPSTLPQPVLISPEASALSLVILERSKGEIYQGTFPPHPPLPDDEVFIANQQWNPNIASIERSSLNQSAYVDITFVWITPPNPPDLPDSGEEFIVGIIQGSPSALVPRPGIQLPYESATLSVVGAFPFSRGPFSPEDFNWLFERPDLITSPNTFASTPSGELESNYGSLRERSPLTRGISIHSSVTANSEASVEEIVFQKVLLRLKDVSPVKEQGSLLSLLGRLGFNNSDPYRTPEIGVPQAIPLLDPTEVETDDAERAD